MTKNSDDNFSVEKLRLKGPLPPLPEDHPAQAKTKRQRREFVIISHKQLAILRKGRASAAAWNVFMELLWLSWRSDGNQIKFTNHCLDRLGIIRSTRVRAIRELAKLGLVRIVRAAPKKSPILIVLDI
jgi:hypothetical protein